MLSSFRLFATSWNPLDQNKGKLEFSRPEYRSVQPFSSPRDLPNPGIEPRSPILQGDSLLTEPAGKPKNTGMGNLSFLQQISPSQELNQGLLPCRWILYHLSQQRQPIQSEAALLGGREWFSPQTPSLLFQVFFHYGKSHIIHTNLEIFTT